MTKQGLNTVIDFHGGVASGSGLGAPDQYTCSSRKKWEVSFTQEELRDLFSLREDTLCDTHDLVGCGCALRKEGVEEELDDITTQKKATKVCSCFVTKMKRIQTLSILQLLSNNKELLTSYEAGSLFSKVSHLCTITMISNFYDPLPIRSSDCTTFFPA